MNKVSGKKSDFALLREDASRIVIGYDCKKVEDEDLYEWYEIYIAKKQKGSISLQLIKSAILDDINAQTDEKILSGFVWNNINIWLSAENQRNFSEAQRMAEKYGELVLPLTFKVGEADDEPVYYTFDTVELLNDFYIQAFAYINQCLTEGWKRKDSIDWEPYEKLFTQVEEE